MYDDMYVHMHECDYVNVYVYKMKGEDTSESLIMYSDL